MNSIEDCPQADCPGPDGWEVGYGLAGGGIGAYQYCDACGRILNKTQDPEIEHAQEPEQ